MTKGAEATSGGYGLSPTSLRLLFVSYLAALAWIVFAPAREASKVTGLVAVIADAFASLGFEPTAAYSVLEFGANIALFVPFGFLLALVWQRADLRLIVAAALGTSAMIELIQMALPSRFSTVSDIIANTGGALLGCVVAARVRRRAPLVE